MAALNKLPGYLHVPLLPTAALVSVLWGCSNASIEPAAGTPQSPSIASIVEATPSPLTPQQVAEAFALGSDSTDLQRELIEKDLVGKVVEWDVRVYEVNYADGIYKITSQEVPITSPSAIPLVRVVAMVQAQNARDDQLLQSIKTDDALTIRGVVQDIVLRTIVVIAPAVIAPRR